MKKLFFTLAIAVLLVGIVGCRKQKIEDDTSHLKQSNRPVYISGDDGNAGHAWVVDGYYAIELYQNSYVNFYNGNTVV